MGLFNRGDKDFRRIQDKHNMFPYSQPIGYRFEDVEKAIRDYKELIEKANKVMVAKTEQIDSLKHQVSDKNQQIVELQLQLENMTITDMPVESSIQILNNFTESNGSELQLTQEDLDEFSLSAGQQQQKKKPTNKMDKLLNLKKNAQKPNEKISNQNAKSNKGVINDSNPEEDNGFFSGITIIGDL